jgi:hypothetical protein
MKEKQIKRDIEIAVALLNGSRTDGYGNGRITHSQRDFIIQTATELLNKTIFHLDQKAVSIVPKNQLTFNLPDES